MKKTLLIASMAIGFATVNAQDYELWGLTQQSGDNNQGTIYKTDSIGQNHEVMYSFVDGDKPSGSLVQHSNGLLYGLTAFGGASDLGIVFSYDPVSESFTKIFELTGTTGGQSRGSFMQASNGMLYATTFAGGSHSKGTIIQLDPVSNTVSAVHSFGATSTDPQKPLAGELIEVSAGMLYGVTRYGGQYDDGTIYSFNTSTATVTKLFDFSSASNGGEPFNSLMEASNGILYGTTYSGGPTNNGAIFAYDAAMDTFAVQEYLSNAGTVGVKPQGGLVEGSDGLLYGMTSSSGKLFSFDPVSTDVASVSSISDGRGTLIEASNGKLYGVAYGGALFQYDVDADQFTGQQSSVGTYALYGHLIEVPVTTVSVAERLDNEEEVIIYPNPASTVINFESTQSIHNITIYNLAGEQVLNSMDSVVNIDRLVPGVYLTVIETEGEVFKKKLIKK